MLKYNKNYFIKKKGENMWGTKEEKEVKQKKKIVNEKIAHRKLEKCTRWIKNMKCKDIVKSI